MTNPNTQEPKRGFWWWLTAILAPVGVVSGPIAMMDMVSGVIEWNGPFEYLSNWWETYVGRHADAVVLYVARLLEVSPPPAWVTDYFTLGLLFAVSAARAVTLIVRLSFGGDEAEGLFILALALVALWPLVFSFVLFATLRHYVWVVRGERRASHPPLLILTLAPFLIFVALFVANLIYGAASQT